jgi:hypothetical protein
MRIEDNRKKDGKGWIVDIAIYSLIKNTDIFKSPEYY